MQTRTLLFASAVLGTFATLLTVACAPAAPSTQREEDQTEADDDDDDDDTPKKKRTTVAEDDEAEEEAPPPPAPAPGNVNDAGLDAPKLPASSATYNACMTTCMMNDPVFAPIIPLVQPCRHLTCAGASSTSPECKTCNDDIANRLNQSCSLRTCGAFLMCDQSCDPTVAGKGSF